MTFNVDIERDTGKTTLRLTGALDSQAGKSLRDALMQVVQHGPLEVVVDVAGVNHIGTSALVLLAEYRKNLELLGGRLQLVHAGEKLTRILDVVRRYSISAGK